MTASSTDSKETFLYKLPQITLMFWIMKILATTLGETGGDHFSKTLHMGYAVCSLIFFCVFLVLVVSQLFARKYIPPLYWAVIVATSTAGTNVSDFMDRTLGLGYMNGSAILLGILLVIFTCWYFSGTSMSVTDIRTRKVEMLYWTAILFSNTLGTALGDYLADEDHGLSLGFASTAAVTGGLIALAACCYPLKKARVFLFWFAFVLTRPFGASFGDYLMRGPDEGCLGFGTGGSSLVLAGMLVVCIAATMIWMWRSGKAQKPALAAAPAAAPAAKPEEELVGAEK